MGYTYFNSDSYFSKLSLSKSTFTRNFICLWMTFAVLNVLIPTYSIMRGRKILKKLNGLITRLNRRVKRAVVLVIVLFNVLYIVATVATTAHGLPNVLECYFSAINYRCRVPLNSTSHDYIIGILITKMFILPVAVLVELAVAIHTWTKSVEKRCRSFTRALVLWQVLVFVQISIGLISIPLFVLVVISPAQVLLLCGGLLLMPMLFVYIFGFISLPNLRKVHVQGFLLACLSTAEIVITAAFITSASTTYFFIVKGGINMDGLKGYIVSLVPAIPVPILMWMFKTKFLKKNFMARNEKVQEREHSEEIREKRKDSFTSDEELISWSKSLHAHTPHAHTPRIQNK